MNFGFYVRKAVFQGFLPVLLAILSFYDFVRQPNGSDYAYKHLYFYTSLILFLHTQIKVILELVFSICSENVVFNKQSTMNHHIITIKRIFKLRYVNSKYFIKIDKFCNMVGIDSPILISYEIIAKLTNVKDEIDESDEETLLYTVLENLHSYDPSNYNTLNQSEEQIDPLIPKMVITSMDKSIENLQCKIYKNNSLGAEKYITNI